ncbi:hypothetical protein KC354_g12698 [Hortaea werneckii]|uniref:NAD dependent epimerase/dehydratase n=1 Tax=Hortaea werneckii TaxID=91943 RepID=A0A3M7E4G3_HORWE|nr:hypothetical protein KC354_g12698 [Hortaea werneckii]RMY71327.1 hypothetical protein D0863_05227 [Hortaea werneckii]
MTDINKAQINHVFDPGDMASLAYQTNIDRRHCTRIVPLRVICLGFSRTGTTSLRQALVDLGFRDCYHYASVLQENPRDADLWIEALNAKFKGIGDPYTKPQWDALLGHCQAVTDTPCILFHEELLAAYPEAKVVLTERDDVDQWFRSQMNTTIRYSSELLPVTWLDKLKSALFSPMDPKALQLVRLIVFNAPVWKELWADYHQGTTTAKKAYEEYNSKIKAIVPRDRLLVFNVKDGWAPLCEFLDLEPPDTPFPRRNDTEVFSKNTRAISEFTRKASRKNMLMTSAAVAAFAMALVAGWQRWK